ncbi:carboxylesterase 1-like [Salvia miltiorrhiza]|uniref:carboxylesterase 1-like n=1 Tax=Salvia miltiorrhiza TaxID=226208 RepID=UPI0025ABC5C2|nr:carboxylesterase 1-like [Salvia miltiorrhiza]
MSSSDSTQTQSISDPYANLGLTKNSDGSFTRTAEFNPTTAACSDPPSSTPLLTKDVPINPHNNTWARIYLPRRKSSSPKLPLVLFFHGGGFVVASAASTFFQSFCSEIALHLPAVMVSVDYRNAPEHRLPAAYDDCTEALLWLKSGDEWLSEHADLSNCYIMGNSAGGNIALRVGLQASRRVDELAPARIRGLILHQPFFGGEERTASEIRLAENKVIPLLMTDVIWELALPVGANRDHEFSNPSMELKLDEVINERWRILVTGYEGDPLIDRQKEVARLLREKGVSVREDFRDGGSHGIEFYDDSFATVFCRVLKSFILAV